MNELVVIGKQYWIDTLCPLLPSLDAFTQHGFKCAKKPLGEGKMSSGVMNWHLVLTEIRLEESAVPYTFLPVRVDYLRLLSHLDK